MRYVRNNWFLVAIAVVVSLPSAAAGRAEYRDKLRAIRNHCAHIEADASRYTTRQRELSGHSAEGGMLTGYFRGSTLQKMVAAYYGESGRTIEEYYFYRNRLIFVLITRSEYDQPLGTHTLNTPAGNVVRASQSRFYFDNGQLIRQVGDKGQPVPREQARKLLQDLRRAK